MIARKKLQIFTVNMLGALLEKLLSKTERGNWKGKEKLQNFMTLFSRKVTRCNNILKEAVKIP